MHAKGREKHELCPVSTCPGKFGTNGATRLVTLAHNPVFTD